MKKSLLFFSLVIAIISFQGITLSAQDEEVPTAIQATFNTMYPEVTDVYWEQDGEEYLASFAKDDYAVDATFLEDGTWQQSITSLEVEDLPENAQVLLKKDFTVESYYNTTKVETPTSVEYSVNFETEKQYVNLIFDTNGKLIDKQVEDL